jgi:NAD(P)-dependent dehydrogenase (short-subunit alcohol dehydrogenase family)
MNTERKVAVITGASRGIGAALVTAFRELSYRVVATVLLQLFAAGGTQYKPCHDETTTSGSSTAGSTLQGAAVHR